MAVSVGCWLFARGTTKNNWLFVGGIAASFVSQNLSVSSTIEILFFFPQHSATIGWCCAQIMISSHGADCQWFLLSI